MWNQISCNSVFERKLREKEDTKLRSTISRIRPLIDTRAPKPRPHLKSRGRKQRIVKERNDEILHENKVLLGKMLKIDLKRNSVGSPLAGKGATEKLNKTIAGTSFKSLNGPFRF
jgi:hypothetical protein